MTAGRTVKELEAEIRRLETAALVSAATISEIAKQRDRERATATACRNLLRSLLDSLDLALSGAQQRADDIADDESAARADGTIRLEQTRTIERLR